MTSTTTTKTKTTLDDYINRFVSELGYDKFFYVSSTGFFTTPTPQLRKFLKDLVDFLDRNHSKDYANALKQCVVKQYASVPDEDKSGAEFQLSGFYGFYVLIKDGKIAAVAQFEGATTLATVTVPKKERGQGHAKIILAAIALAFKAYDAVVIAPTYLSHERLLTSVGWTRSTDTLNPDGTVDLMPEHAKSHYAKAMEHDGKAFYPDPRDALKVMKMNMFLSIPSPEQYAVPKK
jgi:hypothetical protein